MSDDIADKYVQSFLPAIQDATSQKDMARTLRLLVKEVERDTRHKACDVVQEALNKIHNLEH